MQSLEKKEKSYLIISLLILGLVIISSYFLINSFLIKEDTDSIDVGLTSSVISAPQYDIEIGEFITLNGKEYALNRDVVDNIRIEKRSEKIGKGEKFSYVFTNVGNEAKKLTFGWRTRIGSEYIKINSYDASESFETSKTTIHLHNKNSKINYLTFEDIKKAFGYVNIKYEGNSRILTAESFPATIEPERTIEVDPAFGPLGETKYCNSCTNCTTEVQTASSGDTVRLTQNTETNRDGTCIDFAGKDDITFNCSGYLIDGDGDQNGYGIHLNSINDGSNNNTILNCKITEFFFGIYLNRSNNNNMININSSSNRGGMYLMVSNYSNLTNIITSYNINGGIWLYASSYNILDNVTSKFGGNGININIAYGNTIINSNILDNTYRDIHFASVISESYCDHYLENVNSSGNRPIEFYNYSIDIEDRVLSELILCDADNSNITNVTIRGSDLYNNNVLDILETSESYFNNTNSSNNLYGIYISSDSDSNNFTDIKAYNNERDGIYLGATSTNNKINNSFFCDNNEERGSFYDVNDSDSNIFNEITCDTSSPGGICDYACSAGPICGTWIYTDTYLTQDVTGCTGTIFYIGADDITLDCQGHRLETSGGNAINNTGYDNLTVRNCTINSTSEDFTIFIKDSNSTKILNNDISGVKGIELYGDISYNSILNNTINTSGLSNCYGFYIHDYEAPWTSYNLTISNNKITTNGSDNPANSDAIFIITNTINMRIINNRIKTIGTWSDGISTSKLINNTMISDNNFTIKSNAIELLDSSEETKYVNVANNIIFAENGNGIYISEKIKTLKILNNNITCDQYIPIEINIFKYNLSNSNVSNNYIKSNEHHGLDCSVNNLTVLNNIIESYNGVRIIGDHYILRNNTIMSSGTIPSSSEGISVESSNNVKVIGGSITGEPIVNKNFDYHMRNTKSSVTFRDTNFTDIKIIEFYNDASWFNYNNDSSGGVWLKTRVNESTEINRTLFSWTQDKIQWNDTGSGVTAYYNLTDLTDGEDYRVYDNSALQHTLTATGGKINFSVVLSGEREIKVEKYIGPATYNCNSCDNCTTEINQANPGDTVYLIDNISTTGKCIDFNGSDEITFDCQGHNITGDDSGFFAYGIWLNSSNGGSDNNTIKNCKITDFNIGILINSDSNVIKNIIANSNGKGITLSSADYNNLTNITATSNTDYGVYLVSSHYNTLTNINTSYSSTDTGIYLFSADNNNFTNISSNYNDFCGLELQGNSDNNIFITLTTNNNDFDGIHLDGADDNTFINVISNSNYYDGIWFQDSSNRNNFTNVFASLNFRGYAWSSPGNMLINATLSENRRYDLGDPFGTCDTYIENVTGSGGLDIEYYNYTVNIEDKILSELILCEADNSNVTNVTIVGSSSIRNNGLLIVGTNWAKIKNINSSNNYDGVGLIIADFNNLTNITSNNSKYGVAFRYTSSSNVLTNSKIENSNGSGINCYPNSKNNSIYNNLFNNNNNSISSIWYAPNIDLNYWNTTNQTGTRIYGPGTNIAGNAWINGSGTGYYYDCVDSDTDGFCDYAYDVENDRMCPYSTTEIVASNGDVGQKSSIAIDSNNVKHISYYNYTDSDLGYCNGTYGNWDCETVESNGVVGSQSSIAVDSNNNIHISYFQDTNDNLGYCNGTYGNWDCETVRSIGFGGTFTSIAIDQYDNVYISYTNSTNADLGYCNGTYGNWDCEHVDTTNNVGYYSSIAIDLDDVVHISHCDFTNQNLRYCNNSGGSWSCDNIETTDFVGYFSSIAIDSNDNVHISHWNWTGGDLRYCNNLGGSWSCEIVENGISGALLGTESSIAVDSNDIVHISHFDMGNLDLRYCENSKGSWSCMKIADVSTLNNGGRNLAINKGRIVDSTADSNISISWYNNTDLIHTRVESCSNNTDYLPLSDKYSENLCGMWINEDTILTQDITGCMRTIIYINASDITLDCDRHYLQSEGDYGINNTDHHNVTVKNCNISMNGTDGDVGIYYENADNGTIKNNIVTVEDDYAIYLTSSSDNTISNNTITAGDYFAIYLTSSSDNTISNNTATATGNRAIYIQSSNNTNIINNTATAYAFAIFLTQNSNNNTVSNNNATATSTSAIYLTSSSDNTISNNTATAIYSTIRLGSNSNNNILTNNTATAYKYAIILESSSDNTISNNTATAINYTISLWLNSNNNILTNNTATATDSYAVHLFLSSNNNITGGSIVANNFDYSLNDVGSSNTFRNTKFTALREIYFTDTTSFFNYNNDSSGGVWLKTRVSASPRTIPRELFSWTQDLVQWNDSASSVVIAYYNLTDLIDEEDYRVYIDTVLQHTLTATGGKINFSVVLSGGNNISVELMPNLPPVIVLEDPSPSGVTGQPLDAILNVTVTDPNNDDMNVSFWDNDTGLQIGSTQLNIANGSSVNITWFDLLPGVTYYWYANASDGSLITQSDLWNFTTTRDIDRCTRIITSGAFYIKQDIIDSTISPCINISANNVYLNCEDYWVDGDEVDDANDYGIYAYRDSAENSNITLVSCFLSNWTDANIYFRYADNNTLRKIRSVFGNVGIHLSDSDSSEITYSRFMNNNYGIWLSGASDNLIYNNLFNNTINADFTGGDNINNWTAPSLVIPTIKRIYGKGETGGNAWMTSTGTGYYYECEDADRDGICDNPYDVYNNTFLCDSNNCDMLPLSSALKSRGPITYRITFRSRLLKIFRSIL
ncbi:MAG: right-handed parallel beta-helix repeat-containing protein [Candidatus Woesearchaeota archaeon]|nr:MAG: right-handed parallel beta-helix repeat-containing protein [Candidatus Woesearchaeota archaeon]